MENLFRYHVNNWCRRPRLLLVVVCVSSLVLESWFFAIVSYTKVGGCDLDTNIMSDETFAIFNIIELVSTYFLPLAVIVALEIRGLVFNPVVLGSKSLMLKHNR